MKFKTVIVAGLLTFAGLGAPVALVAGQSSAAPIVQAAGHSCTKTSSGTCIKAGQFCPQASYGHIGYTASGAQVKCRGNHTHPHWYYV